MLILAKNRKCGNFAGVKIAVPAAFNLRSQKSYSINFYLTSPLIMKEATTLPTAFPITV